MLAPDRGVSLALTILLVLVGLAAGATAALAQGGPVRYRDPVFQRVQRTNDIFYGQATDIPTGQPVELRLDLYQPQGDTEPARPVLVFIHGGGFVGGDKSNGQRWAEEFARRGWVVASIGYRLKQGNLATVGIPAAVSDARQALRWLGREAASHRLDISRVVVGGSSAGGITALFVAYTELEVSPADADLRVAGVMDLWGALYGQEGEMAAGEPPLLIVHGTEDTVVPYRYGEALRDRAAAVGIPYAFHPLEGVGHGSGETAQISAWTAEFFYPLLWAPGATPTAAVSASPAPASPSPTDPPAGATATRLPATTPPPPTPSPRPSAVAPAGARLWLPVALARARAGEAPVTPLPPVPATVTPGVPTAELSPTPPSPTVGPSATPAAPGVILTESGPVAGVLDGGVWRFLGLPYAAPPLGDLRWRPPVAPEPWTAVRLADAFGPACPQYDEAGAVFGDEDCLTLNVWTPAATLGNDRPRPVLLFIHGGGHEQGAASVTAGDRPLYDGQTFAAGQGLVVVTIQYRLGPFGFLAHPALTAEGGRTASGNYGALDQLAALQWVHDNIAAFGGDPVRVTVFGQSAGSVSTCRLLASPLAAGLLQRAVLMSGACVATPLARAEANGRMVADQLGCAAAADVSACLRGKSTAAIMATLDPMDTGTDTLGRMAYDGVIDGYVLPEAPRSLVAGRRHNAVPVLIGTTSAENGRGAPRIATAEEYEAAVRAYVLRSGLPANVADQALVAYPVAGYPTPRDAYVALTSDVKFVCQARTDARALVVAQSAPVYRYWFDHVPDNGGAQGRSFGAFHGLELPYLFKVLEFGLGTVRYRPGPGDLAVADAMQGYWTRFAATGDPNGDGATAWPAYELTDEPYLRLAAPPVAGTAVRGAQCDFWDGLTGR